VNLFFSFHFHFIFIFLNGTIEQECPVLIGHGKNFKICG
jgi:hypothetical protein